MRPLPAGRGQAAPRSRQPWRKPPPNTGRTSSDSGPSIRVKRAKARFAEIDVEMRRSGAALNDSAEESSVIAHALKASCPGSASARNLCGTGRRRLVGQAPPRSTEVSRQTLNTALRRASVASRVTLSSGCGGISAVSACSSARSIRRRGARAWTSRGERLAAAGDLHRIARRGAADEGAAGGPWLRPGSRGAGIRTILMVMKLADSFRAFKPQARQKAAVKRT